MTESGREAGNALVRSLAAALSPAAEQDLTQADLIAATNSHLQIETMAAALIGKPWKMASPAQRMRLCAALLVPVARTLAVPFRERPKITLLPQRHSNQTDRWQVSTLLAWPTGQSAEVTWRIERNRGFPRIYDVSIDGVSILESMRSQFAEILRNAEIDTFSSRLEALNARD
ncbi:MAG: ABC transporter substrate-binding protein [Sphingomonadales bacterium]|nr:MAG: ABC transporter substrate-binding protein [Sphingomonadales bacterium]